MRYSRVLLIGVVLLLLASLAGISLAAVNPIFVAGNPNCQDLGYAYGYKVNMGGAEDNPWGTWAVGPGTITVYGPNQVPGGVPLNWSSTFGIHAVIMKGGPNANVYVYSPESMGDSGLTPPINDRTGQPYGLSHVEFCYDYEVTVTKDANTSYTRTYTWTIDKEFDGDYVGFAGDSFQHPYKVVADRTETDSDFAVTGNITIYNPDPNYTATVESVADVIDGSIFASVSCGTLPVSLAPGQSLQCTYSANLPDKATRNNVATVTTSSKVGGNSGSASVIFGDPTTIVGYPSVTVNDSNGSSWVANGDAVWEYTNTFYCNGDEGQHVNTATIAETGQSDSATVNVTCYELSVTKDAATTFTRTYTWSIVKTGDQTDLVMMPGQQFLVNYEVTVNATYADSAWNVTGYIYVNNPATIAAPLTGVADIVSPDIAAWVDCGVGFPYSLAAGGTLTCTYSAPLPDAASRLNTATATLQNYSYNTAGVGTPSGTSNFSGTANVIFSDAPSTMVDECINVSDNLIGVLGTVCYDEVPKTFNYSMWVGPYMVCGEYDFVNVASFITNDTGSTGSDDHLVNVSVPCDTGCSLTPGYWKTHSAYGPAPYDDTWDLVDEDAPFYMSGKSWYGALWTPPQGNAYWILARAYIAAYLNDLNGADTTVIEAQLTQAHLLFVKYAPGDVTKGAIKKLFTDLATILDNYNNGLIGPGHCSE